MNEMIPFLRQVAEHYYTTYGADIRHLRFVFPSERSRLFFLRYLGELAEHPIFAPETETISHLFVELAPSMSLLDRTALLFELYATYQEIRGKGVQPFDEFLFWGNIILQDFDLIDRHLVNARDLYRNLENIKEMIDEFDYLSPETLDVIEGFWRGFRNPHKMSEGERADYRRSFLDFWLSLSPLYERFGERLRTQGLGYEGQLYRHLADHAVDVVDGMAKDLDAVRVSGVEARYVFVGLFELTPSEMKLFKAMRRRGVAEFCWDEAVQVVQDEGHGVNRMMRANIEALGSALPRKNYEAAQLLPREIEVVSCASTVTQVKALPELLRQLGTPHSSEVARIDTAIILPSEQLLLPVVSSIPSAYEHLNITLGYPLGRTPVAIFLNRWLRLIASERDGAMPIDRLHSLLTIQLLGDFFPGLLLLAERLRRQPRPMLSVSWILNTYIPNLIARESKDCSAGMRSVSDQFAEALPIARLLLTPRSEAEDFLTTLGTLLDTLGELMRDRDIRATGLDPQTISDGELSRVKMSFDLEFVYHYRKLVTRLSNTIATYGAAMSVDSVARLLEGLTQMITIPFEGNPLKGLQIMGLLESRVLHFSTLIYLSAQEGMLPRRRHANTLIPHSLRLGFGLPLSQWYDDAEAYRFYQSIARADRVILIYGMDDPLGGRGEECRYVTQLEMLYGVRIKRLSAQANLGAPARPILPVGKDRPEIRSTLSALIADDLTAPALSPSAINTYLSCPLRFYYEQIARVHEEETASMLMQPSAFGTILHNTMQEIYAPVLGREVVPEYIQGYLDDGDRLSYIIKKHYHQQYALEGQTAQTHAERGLALYYIGLIRQYVRAVLAYDMSHAPFVYYASEARMRLRFPLSDGRSVNIKGFIDRMDISTVEGESRLRILDYKTGGDERKPVHISSHFENAIPDYKAIFQTLLYCEMVHSGERLNTEGKPFSIPERTLPLMPGLLLTRELIRQSEGYTPLIESRDSLGRKAEIRPILDYTHDVRTTFVETFGRILDEIFDLETPFVPTSDLARCQYCPFTNVCGR